MTDEPTVLLDKVRRVVATVTLNRPGVINAFNIQMRDDLYYAIEAVRDDPEVRAVLIAGSGDRGFCAGADLTEFGTAPSQTVARQVRWERDLWGLFLRMEKPLVAALHGYVIGSGVEIACLCDLRIASEDSVFRMPETALGMVPAAGGSQTLPQTIGLGPAMRMLLTNQVLDAQTALDLGLVHSVVDRESLTAAAFDVAERLAQVPPEAVAAIKHAVYQGMDGPLEAGLRLERRLSARLPATRPGAH